MCGDLSQCFTGLCEQLLLQKSLEEKVNEGGHLGEWKTKLHPTAATLHRLRGRSEERANKSLTGFMCVESRGVHQCVMCSYIVLC